MFTNLGVLSTKILLRAMGVPWHDYGINNACTRVYILYLLTNDPSGIQPWPFEPEFTSRDESYISPV